MGELCKCLYEVTNNLLRNVLAPIGSERFFSPPILPTHHRSLSDDAMDTDLLLSFPCESGIMWEEIIGDGHKFTPPPSPPAEVLVGEMDSADDLTLDVVVLDLTVWKVVSICPCSHVTGQLS